MSGIIKEEEEVESSGSGVACIQARKGVDRVTAAVKGYKVK